MWLGCDHRWLKSLSKWSWISRLENRWEKSLGTENFKGSEGVRQELWFKMVRIWSIRCIRIASVIQWIQWQSKFRSTYWLAWWTGTSDATVRCSQTPELLSKKRWHIWMKYNCNWRTEGWGMMGDAVPYQVADGVWMCLDCTDWQMWKTGIVQRASRSLPTGYLVPKSDPGRCNQNQSNNIKHKPDNALTMQHNEIFIRFSLDFHLFRLYLVSSD